MTSDPDPPVPDPEGEEFRSLSDSILNPGAARTADEEARRAAEWILNTYLTTGDQQRALYRSKVLAWATSDLVLFGKLGTAVGSTALPHNKTTCVGYWQGHGGSTMVWHMKSGAGDGKFIFAGAIDGAGKVTDVALFDVTGVDLPENPGDAVLKTKNKWVRLGAAPAYDNLINDVLTPIQAGTYDWPKN
jgi:hypothetical protein